MKKEIVQAYINPTMLLWSRKSLGLPIEEAAKKIGISTDKLSDCERGIKKLTFNQLIEASNVYKRPVAIFYLNKPPEEFQIPDFRRLPLTQGNSLSPKLQLAIRRVNYQKQTAEEIVEFGQKFDWRFIGSIDIKSDPEDVALKICDFLEITEAIRKTWKVERGRGFFKNWRQLIENKGVLVFLVAGIDVDEMRGFVIASEPYPAIAINQNDQSSSRSFTLLHEFCHILLKVHGLCDMNLVDYQNDQNHKQIEAFCNQVASSILIPKKSIISHPQVVNHVSLQWNDDEIKNLSTRFQVSKEAMILRLISVGKADRNTYQNLLSQWRARPLPSKKNKNHKGGEPIPKKILRMQGKNYVKLVLNAYHLDKISPRDVSDFLDLRLKHLQNLEGLI